MLNNGSGFDSGSAVGSSLMENYQRYKKTEF
jgi:hypothetical protein